MAINRRNDPHAILQAAKPEEFDATNVIATFSAEQIEAFTPFDQ